jgi:hypothetical protein
MGAKVPAVERAMEVQVAIRELRTTTHPLWEAAVASGNWTVIAECKALAATLKVAAAQARRIASLAEPSVMDCSEGLRRTGHGRAA